MSNWVETFAGTQQFSLDTFQRDGCTAIEAGKTVLVSAPTGSGKTIVGEFAVYMALNTGTRCFYTTPIKALSNQKYHDLCDTYGAENVGLLTGDLSLNRDAEILVMTTEVLRNMIYAQSDSLDRLAYVVMDEVHYLADHSRGPIWEEVILNLDPGVQIVALSATVSNVEEFGQWLDTVRGDTDIILWEKRPVPLTQYMLIGSKILPMFTEQGEVNPALSHAAQAAYARLAAEQRSTGPRGRNRRPHRPRASKIRYDRAQVVDQLRRAHMLPAIYFIFSRQGCDGAVDQLYTARTQLTTPAEEKEILDIINRECAEIPAETLRVMNFTRWRTMASRGISAHHAGMLPAFRHVTEILFTRGLLKVVFATETLALGVNMPARAVVLDSMVKFNGESHVDLTAAEYTQLTGRAGRRGIDTAGMAIVLWQPTLDPKEVAGLASTRTYPLMSSFRPGYNMTVNLINTVGVAGAHEILERSFAQFQADGSIVAQAATRKKLEAEVKELEKNFTDLVSADSGADASSLVEDAHTLLEIRARIAAEEKDSEQRFLAARDTSIRIFFAGLSRGDVIALPEGLNPRLVCILSTPHPEKNYVVTSMDEEGNYLTLSPGSLSNTPQKVGFAAIPKGVAHHRGRARKLIIPELRRFAPARPHKLAPKAKHRPVNNATIQALRAQQRELAIWEHPLRETFVTMLSTLDQARGRLAALSTRDDSLVTAFDRMRGLLAERGYLTEDATPALTEEGLMLAGIHHESDLIISQCLQRGVWAGLDPAELAGVVSQCVFENRKSTWGQRPEIPLSEAVTTAVDNTIRIWEEITSDEQRWGLVPSRPLEDHLVVAMHQWTAGAPVDYCLRAAKAWGAELMPGDFVRACRQVADVLMQIATCAPQPEVRHTARQAVEAIRRDVVVVDS